MPVALVGDDDARALAVALGRQPHDAVGRRELDGVVHEVRRRLLDQRHVAVDFQPLGQGHRQGHVLLLGHGAVEVGDPLQRGDHVEALERGAARPRLDLGDAEQGLEHGDDAVQVDGGAVDGGVQVGGGFGGGGRPPPGGRGRG